MRRFVVLYCVVVDRNIASVLMEKTTNEKFHQTALFSYVIYQNSKPRNFLLSRDIMLILFECIGVQ